jgi:type II secretory pathway component PulK
MTCASHRHRGFATVIALVALGLIGVTFAGLMAQLSMDSRRTADELEQAQLRQIVIAAQVQTHGVTQSTDIKLPPQLSQAGYAVTVQIQSAQGKSTPEMKARRRSR